MFIDQAKIYVKAGDGGDGAVTFHREKYVAAGGPDGGDGGRGGDIIFKADDHLSTLADFTYKRKYIAEDGQKGQGSRCAGKSGRNMVIHAPRGTLIKEAETGRLIADLSGDEEVVVAVGGRGGWGNTHFATPTRQAPRFAKEGTPGESFQLQLELKLLADVGLIGFPNVGKSTFISVVSGAKPKIANYHFTTLTPVLGVIRMGEGSSFVMADIPGLIEGASEGTGLGHEFLRHVDRCRLLVHLLDGAGSEGRDPVEDYHAINRELKDYSEELYGRPQIVVANKGDLMTEEQKNTLKSYFEDKDIPFFMMSAATTEGTSQLVDFIAAELYKLPPVRRYEPDPAPVTTLPGRNDRAFTVKVENGVYIVEGDWLLKLLNKTNPNDYEAMQYFQRALVQSGVIDALVEAGVQEGDTVRMYGTEFDYIP